MARKKLDQTQINRKLGEINDWKTENANLLKRYNFENFAEALDFVNKAGKIAERRDHHPDITFGWGYAEFSITTHDAGGLTHNDFTLAKEIDDIKS